MWHRILRLNMQASVFKQELAQEDIYNEMVAKIRGPVSSRELIKDLMDSYSLGLPEAVAIRGMLARSGRFEFCWVHEKGYKSGGFKPVQK